MLKFGRKSGAAAQSFAALEGARQLAGCSIEAMAEALTEHLADDQLMALGERLTGVNAAALAEAEASGFRRGSQRAADLLAHAEFEAAAAVDLLANGELDGLSASSLAGLAERQPDPGAALMLGALRSETTPPLSTGAGGDDKPQADLGWSRAKARAERALGLGRSEGARA